jgi:hypothetical protein
MTTPNVGAMTHHLYEKNVPSKTRNSPTKPLSPGRPIEESATNRKTPEMMGMVRARSSKVFDPVSVSTLINHSHQDEQGSGGEPVVHHLQDAPAHTLQRADEHPQANESEVCHRGVSDQTF